MAGCFRQSNAARDHGVEDRWPEVRANLGGNLRRQVRAGVEHREDDAAHRERRVQVVAHQVDRRDQLREALERVVLALHGDQHGVGRRQRVHREKAKRRRAVDEDVVEIGADGLDHAAETAFSLRDARQLHLGAGEGDRRRNQGEPRRLRGHDQGAEVHAAKKGVVHRRTRGGSLRAEPARRVALGVKIDHEHAPTIAGEVGRDIDNGCGLPDAALLVGARKHLAH